MSKKPKRKFSEEIKRKAVSEYTSDQKTVAEVARELNIAQDQIYQWRIQLEKR